MRPLTLALGLLLAASAAAAHDGHDHAATPPEEAPAATAASFAGAIGGPFRLTDQHGQPRCEADPAGRPQLVFFGYAKCPGICSAALPQMADLADRLAAAGRPVTPVLVTVDPRHDTSAALAVEMPKLHPDFIGLTGTEAALAAVRAAFGVEAELTFTSPEYGPIYSHGSYVYLLSPTGAFLTLLPPILSTERMLEVALSYL